jgi:hypothetical protein
MHTWFNTAVLSVAIFVSGALQGELGESSYGDEAGVLRLINAAESTYIQTHGHYAALPELMRSGLIQQVGNKSTKYSRALQQLNLRSDMQPLAGFSLKLVVSSDGSGYHLYLTQPGERCGEGWFTDERGIVYGGKAIDCVESPVADATNWSPADIDAAVPAVRKDTPCALPQILHEASQRTLDLVENLQRFTATEQVEHTEFGKDGKPRKSSKEKFNYVAEIEQSSSGTFWVEEYREAIGESEKPPLSDTGTAAFALIFHPRLIGNFEIRCEGQTVFQGRPAWQVRFEESADPSKSFHQIRINRKTYQLRFKGRAWIAADDNQILRLQTDLVAPIPEIDLQVEHLDIAYAPVEFQKQKFRLWLPDSASMYIGYRGHRYRRVHTFSLFQLFLVDTQQKTKEPIAGANGAPH